MNKATKKVFRKRKRDTYRNYNTRMFEQGLRDFNTAIRLMGLEGCLNPTDDSSKEVLEGDEDKKNE